MGTKRIFALLLGCVLIFFHGVYGVHGAWAEDDGESKARALFVKTPESLRAQGQDATLSPANDSSYPALGKKRHRAGIALGETFLLGDLKDQGDNGITFDGYYLYQAGYAFDFIANFHLSHHQYQQQKVNLMGWTAGIKGNLYQFDAFAPFVLGGLGIYRPKVTRNVNNQMRESDGKYTLGMHLGGGVQLQMGEWMTMAILGHYHNPFDIKQDVGPDVEGHYFKLMFLALVNF